MHMAPDRDPVPRVKGSNMFRYPSTGCQGHEAARRLLLVIFDQHFTVVGMYLGVLFLVLHISRRGSCLVGSFKKHYHTKGWKDQS